MRKIFRSIILILALVILLSFPVSADDFDNASYIELLDYTTLLNGLNSLVVPTHKSVLVHVPQYEVYTYYELIYRGPSGVTLSIDNQVLTTVSIGNGLFRAYGNATTAGNFVLGLEYSGTSPVSINFYSIRASNISREHYLDISTCVFGSKSYTQTTPSSMISFATDSPAVIKITTANWKKYDFIDYTFTFYDSDGGLNSISADFNGILVPIVVTPWELPDKVEDEVNGTYYNDTANHVVVRLDLRGLDRSLVATPELTVTCGAGHFYLYSTSGFIETNTISPFTYWFNRINASFSALQQRQDAMHQDQLQFYLDNIEALSSLHDDLISAIGTVNGTISSFWSEMSNRLAQFQSSMENQIHGFRSSMESYLLNLPRRIAEEIAKVFQPTEGKFEAAKDESQELAEEKLGAVYQAATVVDQIAGAFTEQAVQTSIAIPVVRIMVLPDVPFEFGGWDVPIVPAGMEFLIDTLKYVIDIVCTLAFLNGMKKRLEGFFGGESGAD